MGCNQTKGDMTGAEYKHFLRTGEFHPDYVVWLTERVTRHATARGIAVGAIDAPGIIVPLSAVEYQGERVAG
jgi:hypothetical protein